MRSLLIILFAAVAWLPAAMARAETVADIVLEAGGEADVDPMDHDLLLRGLHFTGLLDTLRDEGRDDHEGGVVDFDEEKPAFTLWAPNDRAFVGFARDRGYRGGYDEEAVWEFLEEDLGRSGLSRLLRYHITPERITPFGFFVRTRMGTPIPTLHGGKLQPKSSALGDGAKRTRDPRLVFPVRVHASNGIVRSLDGVLLAKDRKRR